MLSPEESSRLIKENDLKNRIKYPRFPSRIIEDFLPCPYVWRNLALQQDYYDTDLPIPGQRSKFLEQIDADIFTDFARIFLKHFPIFSGFQNLSVCFQLVDETYGQGWVHDDDPTVTFSGVIYLNPHAAANTGTTLYDDQEDTYANDFKDMIWKDTLQSSADERKQCSKYRLQQRETFTPSLTVENVFNRAFIYDPRTWHSADNFFGSDKDDSRLTMVFYGKI